jgi:hypothetical protein
MNKISLMFKEIVDSCGKEFLLDRRIKAALRDFHPDIHPSYIAIIDKMLEKDLIVWLDKCSNKSDKNDFELLSLRINFKENNGFDDKAYEVFDAFCSAFNIETANLISSVPNDPVSNTTVYYDVSTINNVDEKYFKPISINNKMTSYELRLSCGLSLGSAIDYLNKYKIKNTNTWRPPDPSELNSIINELAKMSYDFVWCIDPYTKAISIFDSQKGTHMKCNSKEQLSQTLPLLAVSDIEYSPILDKELSINFCKENDWGITIMHGALGEHIFPDDFVGTTNKLNVFGINNWRLPNILELQQIFNKRNAFNIKPAQFVWSSTEPKKFFVNVLDFKTGEVREWKKRANAFDERKGSVILIS